MTAVYTAYLAEQRSPLLHPFSLLNLHFPLNCATISPNILAPNLKH
jgi:hypothetical protein